ncbi:MAG: GntR family transcriptional regulator, partial [Oceanospirillales bacterium]|nr:GntR family transcriptional regulator [Oceanospirillales bacterium]
VSLCSLIIAQFEKGETKSHCSYDEHFELIDALAQRDKEKSVSLMMHHLDHIEDKLNLGDQTEENDLKAIFSNVLSRKSS